MDLRLKDKTVLITGSSRGIGLASAKAFAVMAIALLAVAGAYTLGAAAAAFAAP